MFVFVLLCGGRQQQKNPVWRGLSVLRLRELGGFPPISVVKRVARVSDERGGTQSLKIPFS